MYAVICWQVSYSVNHTIYLYLVSININCTDNVDVTHCVLCLICVFCFVTMYVVFCIYLCVSLYFVLLFCSFYYTPAPRRGRGVYCVTSVLPSVQDIFRHIFLSNCWWQKSDIWSQATYRYTILWVAFLDPSDSYFLFADLVGFYTHWTYMLIFHRFFLSHYWWQKSDIWSQTSYRYPISWEAFLDPSDSYFLLTDFVDFYTHWTYILYIPIFSRIFLSNYWWQKSDIGTPYRGKCFLTRPILTSCLPKSGGILSEH